MLGTMEASLFELELRSLKVKESLERERHSNKMTGSVRGGISPDRKPSIPVVEFTRRAAENPVRALALRLPLDEKIPKERPRNGHSVVPFEMDEATLQKLARLVVREMEGVKKGLPIHIYDFTGENSPFLAEDAIVWLKKLRLAARQDDWDYTQALEVASIHLKGLAARWFASIEKHLNEELHLDRDRWNCFQSRFEERFAGFRSRLVQIEKIKSTQLREGEDVREYAEALMSMNYRLDEPLEDDFLRWVFIQGVPPSELRDNLFKLEQKLPTMASVVSYARRYQLSQSVFQINPEPRRPFTPGRSVRSHSIQAPHDQHFIER